MLGTIMVANVFVVIIPAHRELIAREGGRPRARSRGERTRKARSVHNNYFTLPVLFAMLADHFPFTYGHAHSWLILVCLMVIGAWIRVLLQQPARRPDALVDPADGCGGGRRARRVDAPGRRRQRPRRP